MTDTDDRWQMTEYRGEGIDNRRQIIERVKMKEGRTQGNDPRYRGLQVIVFKPASQVF